MTRFNVSHTCVVYEHWSSASHTERQRLHGVLQTKLHLSTMFQKLSELNPWAHMAFQSIVNAKIFFSLFKSLFEESFSFDFLFIILWHVHDKWCLYHSVGGHLLKESSHWIIVDVKCNLLLPGCGIFSMLWHTLNAKFQNDQKSIGNVT